MTLVSVSIVGVALFYSCLTPSDFSPPNRAPEATLEVRHNGQNLFESSLSQGVRFSKHLDAASKQIAQWGSFLRFKSGQVRSDVLLGESTPIQWAFLREETFFQYPFPQEWIKSRYTDVLVPFLDHLERHGATAIAVPIPTKLSIERNFYPSKLPPPKHDLFTHPWRERNLEEDSYSSYETLVESDPRFIDVYGTFTEYRRQHPSELLYQPMDTHWTSLATALTVNKILKHLELGQLALHPTAISPPRYDQDFFKMLQLPLAKVETDPRFSWREALYTLDSASSSSPRSKRVIVVGSSYSMARAETPYSFPNVLAQALGRELIVETEPGNDLALKSLARLNERNIFIQRGDIVILEFPYRFPWPEGTRLPKLTPAADTFDGS